MRYMSTAAKTYPAFKQQRVIFIQQLSYTNKYVNYGDG